LIGAFWNRNDSFFSESIRGLEIDDFVVGFINYLSTIPFSCSESFVAHREDDGADMKNKFLPGLIILLILTMSTLVFAGSEKDNVLFSQVSGDQKTVFLMKDDGGEERTLVTGKDIKVFLIRKHILYYTNHQLFEYLPAEQKAKLLNRFHEENITVQSLADNADSTAAPDQAVIVAETPYEQNFYILEFSDDSIRSVSNPSLASSLSTTGTSSIKVLNADGSAVAVVHQAGVKLRFELLIQEKANDKLKTSWTLPQNMTVIPELPIWSPDSKLLVFYARESDQLTGFYSLYLYNRTNHKMSLVQEQVFPVMSLNSLSMGSFRPEWSQDGKEIIFQYQPYGLPTESLIFKYEVGRDRLISLTGSRGHNLYPAWSPSGKNILFLSNRDSVQDELYVMDDKGEHLKRLSPQQGYTEWASWYKTE
jgi:hypothetical protein